MRDEEWELLDIKALGTIQLYLEIMVAFNISNQLKKFKDLLDTLARLYENP